MKYQVQKYNTTNHADREVIASHDGVLSQEVLTAWFNTEKSKAYVNGFPPEGYEFAIVPVNHDWYLHEQPQSKDLSASPTMQAGNDQIPNDQKPVTFDQIREYELQRGKEERDQKIASERSLNEALKKLASQIK